MRKKRSGEKGLLSLEACITLPIFMFLMFFLYSFFVVFEARNEMAHVLLSTADSLSFDANENSGLGESGTVGQIYTDCMEVPRIPTVILRITGPGINLPQRKTTRGTRP